MFERINIKRGQPVGCQGKTVLRIVGLLFLIGAAWAVSVTLARVPEAVAAPFFMLFLPCVLVNAAMWRNDLRW